VATKQTNIRLDAELRKWYDDLGAENERDATFYMRKALEKYRDEHGRKLAAKNSAPVKRFVPPTGEQVSQYMAERKASPFTCSQEAFKFVDYYSSKGWKVGKSPMKDWKAAVRNWLKNNFSSGKLSQSGRDAQLAAMDAQLGFGGQTIEGEVQNNLLLGDRHD